MPVQKQRWLIIEVVLKMEVAINFILHFKTTSLIRTKDKPNPP